MRKHITTIILLIILLVGLGLLFYPSVSNWWNERVSSRAISTYDESVANLTDEEYEEMLAAAEDYNTRLSEAGVSAFYNPDLIEGYEDTIDITGTGIMGYITIEKISVQLPIYHGTSVDVLQVAAGHLEGTSLPVGGESTHAVIMAHRGLPSAMLFTDLNELEVGDTFTITVLNRVLTYEVDLISIVEPNDVSLLQIEEGQDYVTLLTCTPYGVNTHRLLVRGHRIENAEERTTATATGEATVVNNVLVAAVVAVILLVPLLLVVFLRPAAKKSKLDVASEEKAAIEETRNGSRKRSAGVRRKRERKKKHRKM